jgi:hypothetical protein
MKLSFFTTFLQALALTGVSVLAQGQGEPAAPGLRYLYRVQITGGPLYPVGKGPKGIRLVVPIQKGTFKGPRLQGNSLDGPLLDPATDQAPQEPLCRWEEIGC